jgi:hypothetical protein
MARFVCLAVVFGLAVTPFLLGDVPTSKPVTASSVPQLIEQLANKDFRVRDTASKAIASLGVDALPELQKGRSHADPEVRRRLDELIPPLERTLTLMPKRVTLHMTNKSIGDVLKELTRQTGYKLAPWEGQPNAAGGKAVYTFHFDKLPFWEALDKVCEASGMVLQQNYWGDDSLHFILQDSYVPFNYYLGPFKVMATGFAYNRTNNFGQLPRNPLQAVVPGQGQQGSESLTVSLTIAVEPKLPIIRVGMVKLTVAEDEEKHSMLPNGDASPNAMWNQRFYYGGGYRSFFHQAQASLVWPSKSSRVVKTLKGLIPVTLLADQKPAIVTEKLTASKGKKFKVGAASFHIEDVAELPGKQYQVKMSITEDSNDNSGDYTRINSLQQRIELLDSKGNKHHFYFNNIANNSPTSIQLTMTVQPAGPNLGPPTKLLYYAWVLMEHEVPFEFKDLPLP